MRHLLGGLAVVTLIGVAATGAPVPKDREKPTSYYPTRVGAKWVYEDNGKLERIWEVTAVEDKNGETVVTVGESFPWSDGPVTVDKVVVSPKGLFQLSTSDFQHDPYCLLKLPLKVGDTWDFDLTRPDVGRPGLRGEKGTITLGGVEEVKVPAGTFKALRVDVVVVALGGTPLKKPTRITKWYAPEVGLVKWTRDGEWTRSLKSFSPGKK